jgi:hypothetical protein
MSIISWAGAKDKTLSKGSKAGFGTIGQIGSIQSSGIVFIGRERVQERRGNITLT